MHNPSQLLFTLGYPPKGSGHGSYMSPVDSAIASGATSGVTTKAASVVAENDLETFEDEEQFQPPQSAGGFGYQGFQDQQPGSKFNSHADDVMLAYPVVVCCQG